MVAQGCPEASARRELLAEIQAISAQLRRVEERIGRLRVG
jgi:hypothetical protein